MKIKKNPLSVEIEITPEELHALKFQTPPHMAVGLLVWIKNTFGLDMLGTSINKK